MKESTKQILKKIGLVASYIPFVAVSVFFLAMLNRGNTMFSAYASSDSLIPATLLNQIITIFSCTVIAIICIMTAISFIMRQNKTANKALLCGCGILSALYMIFFMVMSEMIGLFELSFGNLNLYITYFVMTVFASAIVIYSAVLNLIKTKKVPVTFAKNDEQKRIADKAKDSTKIEETEEITIDQ